jgi:hypothetical protein
MFMEAGGHILLCGESIMTTSINKDFLSPSYPLIFRYELSGNQSGFYWDSEIGVRGIGEGSFAYDDCCLNVVDVAHIQNPSGVRRTPPSCDVSRVRDRSQKTEGLRACIPMDDSYAFPRLELRPEVAGFGKCAELSPPRTCFQPMYGLECLNASSPVFGAPVAFWTSRFATRVPPAGVPARSAVWGFEPAYFNPIEVEEALGIILFDEWQLPRKE